MVSPSGCTTRIAVPVGWAFSNQCALTGSSPWARQIASQWPNNWVNLSSSAPASAMSAPCAARLVTGRSNPVGWPTTLTPIPTTIASPVRSSRMPAILAPSTRTSLGHLIRAWPSHRGATKAWTALAATSASRCAGGSPARSRTNVEQ